MDHFVPNPVILSYQLANSIPINGGSKQQLLDLDTKDRLVREMDFLERFDQIFCANCRKLIALRKDIYVKPSDGNLGNTFYTDKHYMPDLVPLTKTTNITLEQAKEFDRPAWTWSRAKCLCGTEMGWFFCAKEKELEFWGIWRSQMFMVLLILRHTLQVEILSFRNLTFYELLKIFCHSA